MRHAEAEHWRHVHGQRAEACSRLGLSSKLVPALMASDQLTDHHMLLMNQVASPATAAWPPHPVQLVVRPVAGETCTVEAVAAAAVAAEAAIAVASEAVAPEAAAVPAAEAAASAAVVDAAAMAMAVAAAMARVARHL